MAVCVDMVISPALKGLEGVAEFANDVEEGLVVANVAWENDEGDALGRGGRPGQGHPLRRFPRQRWRRPVPLRRRSQTQQHPLVPSTPEISPCQRRRPSKPAATPSPSWAWAPWAFRWPRAWPANSPSTVSILS